MEEVLKEISYFKGITYYISEFCNLEDPLPDCIKTNFTHYANMVSLSCKVFFLFYIGKVYPEIIKG